MRKPKTFFLSSLFSIGLTISFLLTPGWLSHWFPNRANANPPAQTQTAEFRAFWVDAFNPGFKTPQEVTKLIADAKLANANAIVAQVRRRGDAFYTSAIEPRTLDPNVPAGFDPLQDLIDKAHAAGIEVHAWMVTLPVTSGGKLPAVNTETIETTGRISDGGTLFVRGPAVKSADGVTSELLFLIQANVTK